MLKSRLDTMDIRILEALQENAKISNVELAERVHLSPSPCLARVHALEKSGHISRYVTLLDPTKIGLGVSVFIQVGLERQVDKALEIFETAMGRRPEVMECYLMTGESDYLIRVVVSDIQALKDFITRELTMVPGVAHIRSSFALKQIKYKTSLPLNGHAGQHE